MIFRQRGLRRTRLDDRGGVTVFVAVCVFALIGIIGVAVDGGSKMRATERADYVAGEAARAGGQAIDPVEAITGKAIVVDPQDAQAAAQAYLRSVGATGTVSVSGDGKTLNVTITGYVRHEVPVGGRDRLVVGDRAWQGDPPARRHRTRRRKLMRTTHSPAAAAGRTLARVLKAVLSLLVLAGAVARAAAAAGLGHPGHLGVPPTTTSRTCWTGRTRARRFCCCSSRWAGSGGRSSAFCAVRELIAQVRGRTLARPARDGCLAARRGPPDRQHPGPAAHEFGPGLRRPGRAGHRGAPASPARGPGLARQPTPIRPRGPREHTGVRSVVHGARDAAGGEPVGHRRAGVGRRRAVEGDREPERGPRHGRRAGLPAEQLSAARLAVGDARCRR